MCAPHVILPVGFISVCSSALDSATTYTMLPCSLLSAQLANVLHVGQPAIVLLLA